MTSEGSECRNDEEPDSFTTEPNTVDGGVTSTGREGLERHNNEDSSSGADVDVYLLKLRLEEKRVESELKIREAELALKRDEFEAKRKQKSRKQHLTFSPLVTGIIAAAVGLIGTAVGSYMQGRYQLDIERLKFESNLILKAIETGNQEEAKRNLLFLLSAGFIQDKDGRIAALAEKKENVPVLPSSASTASGCDVGLVRTTIDTAEGAASVYISGVLIGQTPITFCEVPGRNVQCTLKRQGYLDKTVVFSVRENKNVYTFMMERKR